MILKWKLCVKATKSGIECFSEIYKKIYGQEDFFSDKNPFIRLSLFIELLAIFGVDWFLTYYDSMLQKCLNDFQKTEKTIRGHLRLRETEYTNSNAKFTFLKKKEKT